MTDEQIVDMLIAHESAVYADDPLDRGRCSKYGITLATLRDWRGHPVTCEDVRTLQEPEAREIFRARYVKPFDGMDDEVKPQLVDIAVLSGVLTARTLLALATQDTRSLPIALVIQRIKHIGRLVKARPDQLHFLNGWLNRALSFL